LEDIVDPFTQEVLLKANQLIDENAVELIENTGLEKVKIRSVLTCESTSGVCTMCYGRNLASGEMASIGEAVGVVAAQSIGEPGTQLTMRTFHIGGTASRITEQTTLKTKKGGRVRYLDLKIIRNKEGHIIVMKRNGKIIVQDENGREKERFSVVYGAKLKVQDGQEARPGDLLAEWDPFIVT
jgi:DNA-directed RNA polymerase subunit beta'